MIAIRRQNYADILKEIHDSRQKKNNYETNNNDEDGSKTLKKKHNKKEQNLRDACLPNYLPRYLFRKQ